MKEELKPVIVFIAVVIIIGGLFYFFDIPTRTGDIALIDSLNKSIELKELEILKLGERLNQLEKGISSTSEMKHSVTLSLENFPKLEGFHYELWANINGAKISVGIFNFNEKNEIINLAGYKQEIFFNARDLKTADSFIITIEPDNDFDPKPSGVEIVSGSLSGNSSNLSFNLVDFQSINGSFILATPTNGFPPINPSSFEESGLWFVFDENFLPSLNIPIAPKNWVYESWIFLVDTPISLGKFSSPNNQDDFNGLSDLEPGFVAPGEDLLRNAETIGLPISNFPLKLNRGDYLVKVSLEPLIDVNGEKIFLELFSSTIPLNSDTFTSISLEKIQSFPEGTIVLE